MPHDHAESKTVGKSGGSPARGKASPPHSARARAVLHLQKAAGNRAVTGILTDPDGPIRMQPTTLHPGTALYPVSLQRDELVDALRAEITDQAIDFQQLARGLIHSSRTMESGGLTEPKKTSATGTETGETSGTEQLTAEGTAAKKGPETPLTEDQLKERKAKLELRESRVTAPMTKLEAETKEVKAREKQVGLAEREKELRQGVAPEDLEARDKEADLNTLEKQQKDAEALRLRAKKLKAGPTAEERANQIEKARLDNQEKAQQVAEMKRKLSGQLTPEEQQAQDLQDELDDMKKQQEDAEAMRKWNRQVKKPLNPQNKNLGQLLGGRKF